MPILCLLFWMPGDVEPPKVGQPLDFSGAVGAFRVELRVARAEVIVEEPVTLTFQLRSNGLAQRPPRRPDLKKQRGYDQDFHIGRSASDAPDRTLPDGTGWEFDYELRPRTTEVTEVPGLRFVYFDPKNNRYQTSLAKPVPLTVKPRPEPAQSLQVDERFLQLATGHRVLERWHVGLPPLPWLVVLALLPLVTCVAWYGLWAWRNPAVARQARQRRSRAGRHALESLRQADALTAPAIVTDYLRQRFDLPGAAPTPAEVAAHLQRFGVGEPLAVKSAEFFRASDEARYAPRPNGDRLPELAVSLIKALET